MDSSNTPPRLFTAFAGHRQVLHGPLDGMIAGLQRLEGAAGLAPLVFEDATGRQIDFDLRGMLAEAVARAEQSAGAPPAAGRGRPRLGVVGREVSLLPRHWAWLEQQPSGASATLRRLVEEALRRDPAGEAARAAAEAASRVMTGLAGDLAGYEEATRALFAGDAGRFDAQIAPWPEDVRRYVRRVAGPALGPVG